MRWSSLRPSQAAKLSMVKPMLVSATTRSFPYRGAMSFMLADRSPRVPCQKG